MSKYAIPQTFSGRDVKPLGRYVCPLCSVQSTTDEVDTGWVYCPMLNNAPICLGSCIDYQKVARSDNFEKHPFHDLFERVSHITEQSISSLRQICLEHQEEIVAEATVDSDSVQKYAPLLAQIREARNKI